MKKQKQYRQISQSRKRVESVFQEQEEVSKAFQLTNFYTNQRLNIGQLKQRLQKFKRSQFYPPKAQGQSQYRQRYSQFNNFPSIQGNKHSINDQQKSRQITSTLTPKQEVSILKKRVGYDKDKQMQNYLNSREYQTQKLASKQFQGHYNIQKKQDIKSLNYNIIKQINKHRYDNKTKTSYGIRQNQKDQQVSKNTINYYYNIKNNKSKSNAHERTQNSRTSQRSHNFSLLQELHIQGRIFINQKDQLYELQKHIHVLWQHYQLLTKLLLALKEGKNQEKNAIVKYVQDICSDKLQFIRSIIQLIKKDNPSKVQQSFMKRLKKTIILSRLYENLSILYVSLDICFKKLPDSHLVNYIGYCSSNIIFLLRFTQLIHSFDSSLQFSQNTKNILAVIAQFENQSYKNQITKVGDLILRMQHNNQTIAIIQNRLCNNINKEFQDTILRFIKNVDIENKILFQYGHYIFEYLAYYLASIKVVGQFSFIEIAPSPYFPVSKKRTLVIEPWEVLFAFKDTNTYLRAYSQQMLNEIGKHWNLIYWTDLMPEKIDDLMQRLPYGKRLYQYHCRYQNQRFLKLLWRIGSDTENTIIIDREQSNFKYDKQMGIELPWKGKGKDTKLLDILNAFIPLINSDDEIPLRKSFPLVKQQLMGSLKRSRGKRIQSKGNQYNETNGMYPKNLKLPQNSRFKYVQQ